MPITIATFNVNSLRARLANVQDWLRAAQPDVALLQEIKCQEADFPHLEFQSLGYSCAALGQKSYNGVAILSRHKFEIVQRGLPGDDSDDHARYMEADIEVPDGRHWQKLRVATIYLPKGNPVETEKYPYKLAWMKRLYKRAGDLLAYLMFDGGFTAQLVELGRADARAKHEELCALFAPVTRIPMRSPA